MLQKLSDAVTCNNVYKAEKLLGFFLEKLSGCIRFDIVLEEIIEAVQSFCDEIFGDG